MIKSYATPAGTVHNLYLDMLRQTHILIAGATGSGKSVVINGIIHTALFHSPAMAEFILIDPKRVELVEYRNMPHTLRYASEPKDMIEALEYAVKVINDRFTNMQKRKLRKWDKGHVYIIIDELADLMTTNAKQVTPLIQRICQIGRASGVHMIAATQCPLSTVIPTAIKVNFDCKVALHTASKQHSRNIMDCAGCEALPRYGKAYYITPDRNGIVNVPMIEEKERQRIIKHWAHTKAKIRPFARLFA